MQWSLKREEKNWPTNLCWHQNWYKSGLCVFPALAPIPWKNNPRAEKVGRWGVQTILENTTSYSLDVLCFSCQENGHISIYPHLEFLSVKDPNTFSCQTNLAGFSVVTEAGQAFFFCEVVEAAWENENAFFLLHKHRCWCVNWGELG